MADGVPHFRGAFNAAGNFYNLKKITSQRIGPFATGIPVCSPWHWSEMIYDPSIAFLFGAPAFTPAVTPSSNAGVIAGAVVGSIVAAIVIVVVLVIFVPPVRYFFMPFSKPRTAPTDVIKATPSSVEASERSTSNVDQTSNNSRSDWNPAVKPQ